MKHGTPDLMKFCRAMRKLQCSKRDLVATLELLWLATAKNCPRGDIGKFNDEEIAIFVEWPGDPDKLIAALVETRWLDEHPEHRLVVHDWHDHAPTWVRGVVARKGGFVTDFGAAPRVDDSGLPTQGIVLPSQALPSLTHPSPTTTTTEEAAVEALIGNIYEATSFPPPTNLKAAIRQAMANGCSVAQLRERVNFFAKKIRERWWPEEHLPGALYEGLSKALPTMPVDVGWPYVAAHVAKERRNRNGSSSQSHGIALKVSHPP